jgi:hypothetical protein
MAQVMRTQHRIGAETPMPKFIKPTQKLQTPDTHEKYLGRLLKYLKYKPPSVADVVNPNILLFIDPGVNTGYCALDVLSGCMEVGTWRMEGKQRVAYIPEESRLCWELDPVVLIWEKPKLYVDKIENADALFKMCFMGGLLIPKTLQIAHIVDMPVQRAQGSMDKKTRHARMVQMSKSISSVEDVSDNALKSVSEHARDALYMCLNILMEFEQK